MNMFEQSVRSKLRFETSKGSMNVEDLWDLKLTGGQISLDGLAKGINKQLKEEEEESFVVQKSKSSTTLNLKFEIVKHIINVKIEEEETAKNSLETKIHNEKILGVLADLEDHNLRNNLSPDELKAMLR